MCSGEGFQPIGISAALVIEKLAAGIPTREEDAEMPAGAQAGVAGGHARARHSAGEGTGAVILIFVPRRGRARPNTSPATMGELHRITGEGRTTPRYPPADGRLVNARRAKRV